MPIRRALRRPAHWRRLAVPASFLVLLLSAALALQPANSAFLATTTSAATNNLTADGAFPTQYHAKVAANTPWIYHQMDNGSGNAVTDSSGGGRNGTYVTSTGSAVLGPGSVVSTAGNGSADASELWTANTATSGCGYLAADTALATTTAVTIEFWFKTLTDRGGVLVDDASQRYLANNSSGNVNRYVYLETSGKLRFGVQVGGTVHEVISDSNVANNGWHLVDAVQVGSAGNGLTAGLNLFIDGTKQASTDSTTTNQGGNRYWRVGCDNAAAFVNTPDSYGYSGLIDDVAIYGSALSSTTITAHNTAAGGANYQTTVIGDSPAIYWKLNDSAATGQAADSSGNGVTAHYYNFGGSAASSNATGATGDGDTGFTFSSNGSGSSGQCASIAANNSASFGANYTIEFWFKATSNLAGALVSSGNSKYDVSNQDQIDRFVYLNSAHQLEFGVQPSALNTPSIASTATYNDGNWHLVQAVESTTAATGIAKGLALYVDGNTTPVASDAGTFTASGGGKYWRVGCDNLANLDQPPTNYGFSGSIDDVAIYSSALTTTRLHAHYTGVGANYTTGITADSPWAYWRLNETSTTVNAADSGSLSHSGTFTGFTRPGTVTYGVSGALVNAQATSKAITMSTVLGVNPAQDTDPQTYTVELWFKTTNGYSTGGPLASFSDTASGIPTKFDRMLWMDDTGKLHFGANGNIINSASAYNDGSWHMADVSNGAAGMKLFVDGNLVASNAGATASQSYNGYWRWGYTQFNSWTPNPTSYYFNASLDELSVLHSQLSNAAVAADYAANY
jgi:hypothetical protein